MGSRIPFGVIFALDSQRQKRLRWRESMTIDRILFVDDEQSILKSLKRVFINEPYEVFTSNSPSEALKKMEDTRFAVVVSDERMPEMEGTAFLKKVKERWPDVVRMILTGYADLGTAISAINQGNVYRFINKPWDDTELKLTVKNALAHYELVSENKRLFELTRKQNEELLDLNLNLAKKVEQRTEEIKKLLQRLKKSFVDVIRVFTELMELFNPWLGGHAKRVAALVKEVAKRFDLGDKDIELMEMAALLHDIGLIGLPRSLLEKAEDKLRKSERALLTQHPMLGYETLNKIEDLRQVSVIVKWHHENFDGTGYPDGLSKEEIPLAARVIRVASDYDNLVNKKKMLRRDALSYLNSGSGKAYDPDVIFEFQHALEHFKLAAEKEVSLPLPDLRPGMILSREIRTSSGRLLIGRNGKIEKAHLEKLLNFHKLDPIVGRIYVYKSTVKGG